MNQGYLGLEITSSKLRYVYITQEKKGYVLKRAGAVDFKMDITQNNGLAMAINQILNKESLLPKRVFLSFSRQDTLIRQIVLPRMTSKDLDEVIRAEIQKVPSYTNKEFDYILNKSLIADDKIRVIFAALHKDVLQYIFNEVEKSEIAYRHFEISPLNLQELMYKQQEGVKTQALFLVNDFSSYLVIFKKGEYQLLYKTATGIENLYPENKTDISPQVLSALTSEIKRVLKSYETENKGETVNRVTLVWDRERAVGFFKELSDKVGAPVNVPSLSQFTSVDLQVDSHMDNPIYGLACVPIFYHLSKMKAQFAFDHFFKAAHFKKLMIRNTTFAGVYLLLIALALGSVVFVFNKQTADLKVKTAQIDQEMATLTAQAAGLFQKRDELVAVRQGLIAQASYIKALNRVSWSQVLAVASDEMPEELALTTFKFSEAQSVTFKGEALQVETVAELMRRIEDSIILQNGAFDFLKEKTVDDYKVYQFGIMAQLKQEDDDQENLATEEKEKTK